MPTSRGWLCGPALLLAFGLAQAVAEISPASADPSSSPSSPSSALAWVAEEAYADLQKDKAIARVKELAAERGPKSETAVVAAEQAVADAELAATAAKAAVGDIAAAAKGNATATAALTKDLAAVAAKKAADLAGRAKAADAMSADGPGRAPPDAKPEHAWKLRVVALLIVIGAAVIIYKRIQRKVEINAIFHQDAGANWLGGYDAGYPDHFSPYNGSPYDSKHGSYQVLP